MTQGRDLVAGRRGVTEAIRAGQAREVLVAEGARGTQGLREVLAAADRRGIAVREVAREELDALVPQHRGVVARVRRGGPAELDERAMAAHPFPSDAVVVILDGVEDPQNLGAAARSAEAAGASMLVSRTRRAAPTTEAAIRASAGALEHLPHARVANIARAIGRLQEVGFFVIGLDADAEATVHDSACPSGQVAIVLGSEGAGLSRLVRERCDALVALPMRGRVGSLNVAASLAAVLYAYVLPSRTEG